MDNNVSVVKGKKGIYGSTLKLIAIITMLIDHIGAVILQRMLAARGMSNAINALAAHEFLSESGGLYGTFILMRLIGRVSFPIFCFLLVEGFIHTRSIWKYAFRLAVFALVSEIPFDLATEGKLFYFDYQNVFFTLLIGLFVMIGFKIFAEKAKDKKWLPVLAVIGAIALGYSSVYAPFGVIRYINDFINGFTSGFARDTTSQVNMKGFIAAIILSLIALVVYGIMIKKYSLKKASLRFADLTVLIAGLYLAQFLKTDYSAFGVLTIAVMYGLRKSHVKSMLGGCVTLTIMSATEAPAFLDIILAHLYNGKRGLKLRYVFYAFYPVHLFLLYMICYFMDIL